MITIVKPSYEILTPTQQILDMPRALEIAGRTCYKSEDRITDVSGEKFVRMICRRNHVSVLEHCSISARIICSRACSHQLVRHRLAAYSQESQRYCNYGKKDFQFICPQSVGLEPGVYGRNPKYPTYWILIVCRCWSRNYASATGCTHWRMPSRVTKWRWRTASQKMLATYYPTPPRLRL